MAFQLKKIHANNIGYGQWSNYVIAENNNQFNEIRTWAWNTWGASKELDSWIGDLSKNTSQLVVHNEYWVWKHDEYGFNRIYFRTEKEVTLFKLRWE